MKYVSLFAGIGGLQVLEGYDMIETWQINIQLDRFQKELLNYMPKDLPKRKLEKSLAFLKKWFLDGLENSTYLQELQRNVISGEKTILLGKEMMQAIKQNIIGWKNNLENQIYAKIAEAQILNIGEHMSGLTLTTNIEGY